MDSRLLANLTTYARVTDDKASHDRLTAAATGFLERYVASLGGGAAGGSSGSAGGSGGNALGEWELLEPRTSHRFTMVGEGKFETNVEWLHGVAPGATMRWATVPGKNDGLTWRIPSEPSIVGKTLKISTDSVAQRSFTVEALMCKRDVTVGEGGAAAGDGSAAAGNGGAAAGDGEGGAAAGADGDREPVPSRILPPIPTAFAHAQLAAIDYVPGQAEAEGDCFPLSAAGGFELTADQCAHPDTAAVEHVRTTRNGAIDLVAGAGAVGGIDASVFRNEEKLPPTAADAEEAMVSWRGNYHWEAPEGEEHKAACFQFGIAATNKRPSIVMEKTLDKKGYLNPLRVYAETNADGSLRRSAAKPRKPETVPVYFLMPFDEALAALRGGKAYSLVGYDRRASHFFPFVKKELLSPTEAVSEQLDDEAALHAAEEPAEVADLGGQEEEALEEPADEVAHLGIDQHPAGVSAGVQVAEVAVEVEAAVVEAPPRKRACKSAREAEPQQAAPVAKVAVVSEATLAQCLSGRYAHLRPVAPPPPWLAGALGGDAARLHGELVAFLWEDYGWCVARLGATKAADANVSGLYEDRCREHHALLLEHYGTRDDAGSWVLLAPARPASPLLGYAAGRYKKQRAGANVWLRADELVHHSGAELAAARAAAKSGGAAAVFEAGRCDSTECTLGAGHEGLCSHLRAAGKRRRP